MPSLVWYNLKFSDVDNDDANSDNAIRDHDLKRVKEQMLVLTEAVTFPKIGSGILPAFFNIKSNDPPSCNEKHKAFK